MASTTHEPELGMNLPSIHRPRVLLVGADPATLSLIEEWLADDGIDAIEAPPEAPATPDAVSCEDTAHAADSAHGERYDVVLVDVAYPRDEGCRMLHRIAQAHPDTPVVALSSGFFGNVAYAGPCARQLSVAGVLPKPVTREALLAAVRKHLKGP